MTQISASHRLVARAIAAVTELTPWQQKGVKVYSSSHAIRPPLTFVAEVHTSANSAHFPSDAMQQAITPAVSAALASDGYAVVNNVFNASTCKTLRDEIKGLAEGGRLHLNATHLITGGARNLLEKANIFETGHLELDDVSRAPMVSQLSNDSTLLTMLNIFLPRISLTSQTFKVQYNAGAGGSFPIHTDNDEEVDGRRISGILYLNPTWRPEHGGVLRLYPWPRPAVDIEPLSGRLVLFSSCQLLHRVLPSFAPRYCYLLWLSVSPSVAARSSHEPLSQVLEALPSSSEADEATHLKLMAHPKGHQYMAKISLAKEWEQSIVESHPDTPARTSMIDAFWRDIGVLQKQLAKVGLSDNALAQAQVHAGDHLWL